MKYLICTLGFVCLILTVNAGARDDHVALRQKCFDETGFDKDERSVTGTSTFLQNPKIKCFLKCVLEGLNLYKDDGSIDAERAVQTVDAELRDQVRPLINKCVEETANIGEKCEQSFAAVKCLYEGAGETFELLGLFEPPKAA